MSSRIGLEGLDHGRRILVERSAMGSPWAAVAQEPARGAAKDRRPAGHQRHRSCSEDRLSAAGLPCRLRAFDDGPTIAFADSLRRFLLERGAVRSSRTIRPARDIILSTTPPIERSLRSAGAQSILATMRPRAAASVRMAPNAMFGSGDGISSAGAGLHPFSVIFTRSTDNPHSQIQWPSLE
jgi:hypothetical protein